MWGKRKPDGLRGEPDEEEPCRHGGEAGAAQGGVRLAQKAPHGPAHAAGSERPDKALENQGQARGAQEQGQVEVHAPWCGKIPLL